MKGESNITTKNMRQGANEVNSGLIQFAIWAPGKNKISLVGDFNDWDIHASPMKNENDGIWWLELEMQKGVYEYMYAIDDEIYICDPYAKEVNWTENGAHAVLRIDENPFEWTDDDFQMPAWDSMVIYELHVGDFTAEGTFQAMVNYLDYLKDLGINVIELMPVFEFPGDFSWGYNPAYTMAVEKTYGSLSDFKNLINEAHRKGIAVILDIVFYHVDDTHPFTKIFPMDENPYFTGDENPWGFPNLDHNSDAVKGYIHRIQEYWLKDCHIDGLRYDASANIGYDEMNGVTYMAYDARNIQSHVFLIAEHVPEDRNLIQATEINALWHRTWHHTIVPQLTEQEYESYSYGDMEQMKKLLDPKSEGYGDVLEIVNFTEGHDWERIVYMVQQNEDMADSVLKKSVLGAALLFTTPGIPMILYGQEVATAIPKESTFEEGHRPDWGEAFKDDGVKWLFECYKRLIWLRREEKALHGACSEIWYSNPESKVLIYRRFLEGEDTEIIVMLNFTRFEQAFEFQLPRGGKYHEVLSDDDWVLEDGNYRNTIPGSTARVLKRIGEC